MKIPAICHEERIWWEQLGHFTSLRRNIQGRDVCFIVERTREGFVHACTVDDLCRLLDLVPANDWESLVTFVLRQSTRKQSVLTQNWGRLAYSADLGQAGRKSFRCGSTVFLEAVNPSASWCWEKDLTPAACVEMQRLVSDGHKIQDRGKYFLYQSSLEAVRATQLFRTLLHEIGHWVDWLEKVGRRSTTMSLGVDVIEEQYFARPTQERESFAHHYADSLRANLLAAGLIPFSRLLDATCIRRDGLDPSDFIP